MPQKKRYMRVRRSGWKMVLPVLAVLVLAAVVVYIGQAMQPPLSPVIVEERPVQSSVPQSSSEASSSKPESEPKPVTEPEPEDPVFEVGKFGPDQERAEYISASMTLRVPAMGFEGPVYSMEADVTPGSPTYKSISEKSLDKGVSLFGAAQVPGRGNRNVSMAAHRDIRGKEFYYIDRIREGDFLYLTYEGNEYIYLFEESFVTTSDNWDPIRVKDYSCITLQSCTPINVASHRIFVVGRLVEIRPLEE